MSFPGLCSKRKSDGGMGSGRDMRRLAAEELGGGKKMALEQDFEDATLLCIHSDELENIQAKFYAFYKHCLSLVLLAS